MNPEPPISKRRKDPFGCNNVLMLQLAPVVLMNGLGLRADLQRGQQGSGCDWPRMAMGSRGRGMNLSKGGNAVGVLERFWSLFQPEE